VAAEQASPGAVVRQAVFPLASRPEGAQQVLLLAVEPVDSAVVQLASLLAAAQRALPLVVELARQEVLAVSVPVYQASLLVVERASLLAADSRALG
jgi:hypothetical protein